ncbi:DUF2690 domain-containing protein [Pseudonocardia sp. CA-142604]|uniref:DUF2690 domain-containing protein n=1 Tax=Pseudonocardia sp. CA-142604 TaxID=3240024 RepID=UPI003D9294FA
MRGRTRVCGRACIRLVLLTHLLVVTALFASIDTFALTPTALAATCQGPGCNYQDPMASGCTEDGRTIDSFVYEGANADLAGTLMELRYSPACDAAWVRATGGTCLPRDCGVVLEASRGSGSTDEYSLGNASGGANWTNLLSFRYYVRGCFATFDLSASTGYVLEGCTSWH